MSKIIALLVPPSIDLSFILFLRLFGKVNLRTTKTKPKVFEILTDMIHKNIVLSSNIAKIKTIMSV